MAGEKTKYLIYPLLVAVIVVGVLFLVTTIDRQRRAEQTTPESGANGTVETPPAQTETPPAEEEKPVSDEISKVQEEKQHPSLTPQPVEQPAQDGIEPSVAPKSDFLSMKEVIAGRTSWDLAFTNWFGRQAPDFSVRGLDGKTYTLSSYKGTDVMLVFWATWCGPCRAEIPYLKELRKEYTNEQLAILALSDEDPQQLKNFVKELNIPYPILLSSRLPDPYSRVNALPSTFFIDPQGNIKLATIGMLNKETMQKVLKAQWEE